MGDRGLGNAFCQQPPFPCPLLLLLLPSAQPSLSLFQELESEQHRDQFFQLVPAMMDVMKAAVQSGEEKNAQEALETFIEVRNRIVFLPDVLLSLQTSWKGV